MGVGAKSLFDHLESPTAGRSLLPSGALKKSMKASLDWKGAAISALLGIENLPISQRYSSGSGYSVPLRVRTQGQSQV